MARWTCFIEREKNTRQALKGLNDSHPLNLPPNWSDPKGSVKETGLRFPSPFSCVPLWNCSFNKQRPAPPQQRGLPRRQPRCKHLTPAASGICGICRQTAALVGQVLNLDVHVKRREWCSWAAATDNVVKRLKIVRWKLPPTPSSRNPPSPSSPLQLSHQASFDDSIKLLPRSLTSFCL